MTPTDISKPASKGPYKGKPRQNIFALKIKAGAPFTLTDGTEVKGIKWDKKNNILIAKAKGSRKEIEVPLSKIKKDVDFGGDTAKKQEAAEEKGQVSNKDVEVLSEAFFCYYFALHSEKKLDAYTPTIWKTITTKEKLITWCRSVGITSYVETQNSDAAFISRLHLAIPFLVTNKWHDRLMKQINKFMEFVRPSAAKSYEAMRADEVPAELNSQDIFEMLAEKIKQKYKFSKIVDKDKWNPGDVWIFSQQAKTKLKSVIPKMKQTATAPTPYQAGAIADLNKVIYDLYESKDLYPVSLKAPGAIVHISEENVIGSSVTKVVRFKEIDLSPSNLDIKIKFAIDLYDIKAKKIVEKNYFEGQLKSKTDAGGFRLEIEKPGSAARYGSMGTENYQWIISNTDDSGVKKLEEVRKKFKDLKDLFPIGDKWLGASNYSKSFKEDNDSMQELKPYLDKLYGMLNSSGSFSKEDSKSILNKTIASEIGIAIQFITNKLKRDITVENLYDFAASQRFSAGVRPDQLERRKGIYGKEAEAMGPAEAQHVFESCFYLKLY